MHAASGSAFDGHIGRLPQSCPQQLKQMEVADRPTDGPMDGVFLHIKRIAAKRIIDSWIINRISPHDHRL